MDNNDKPNTHTRLALGLAIHARHAVNPYDNPRISIELELIDKTVKEDPPGWGAVYPKHNVAYLWSGVPITRITMYHSHYTQEEITELLSLGWILDTEEDTFKFKLDSI